jgi:hypothetical protein
MKLRRTIHIAFVSTAIAIPLVLVWALGLHLYEEAQTARFEAMEKKVRDKLDEYYFSHGQFPDSLQKLSFSNSVEEIKMKPMVQKVTYVGTGSHYSFYFPGRTRYQMTISNAPVDK